jgi:lysozyme family protein
MSTSNFNTSLKYVLVDEGGNDDDPQDHGGRTSRGITQREYDSWCTLTKRAGGDVWKAKDKDIAQIYHDQYWDPYCDDLPDGLDYVFFDTCVNAGRQRAVKTFQKALGVSPDGMMGQVTFAAIKSTTDLPSLIKEVCDVRRDFYRNLAQYPRYGKGWLARVNHCESGALALTQSAGYHPIAPSNAPKTHDMAHAGPTVSPQTTGTVSTGAGGIIGVLHQFQQDLLPYKETIKYVEYILLGVIGVGFLYTLWGMYKTNKVQQVMN